MVRSPSGGHHYLGVQGDLPGSVGAGSPDGRADPRDQARRADRRGRPRVASIYGEAGVGRAQRQCRDHRGHRVSGGRGIRLGRAARLNPIAAAPRHARLDLDAAGAAADSTGRRSPAGGLDNELWLSPISVWEALLLLERGRVRVGLEPGVWFAQALRAMPVRDANLTREIVLASRSVDLHHHEGSADRLIAATAAVLGLTLVRRTSACWPRRTGGRLCLASRSTASRAARSRGATSRARTRSARPGAPDPPARSRTPRRGRARRSGTAG
jgi:PIN domain nuclease of toxin-antitoxin system